MVFILEGIGVLLYDYLTRLQNLAEILPWVNWNFTAGPTQSIHVYCIILYLFLVKIVTNEHGPLERGKE